jgi:hypothetical protein
VTEDGKAEDEKAEDEKAEDEKGAAAVCVVRCEKNGYGFLVTVTQALDVHRPGTELEGRFARAADALEAVRRFLVTTGVPD